MDNMQNLGLLTLRAGVGGVLLAHGVQKLFGWLGGAGLTGTADALEQMGFRPGLPSAVAAGVGEAGGGALIVLGLFTPAAGAAAAGTMIPAAAVHAPKGFFATGGGYEYPALLGLSAAALALAGPGDWSVDARLGHGLNPPWMVAATLLASAAASALVLQRRRTALTGRSPRPPRPPAETVPSPMARRHRARREPAWTSRPPTVRAGPRLWGAGTRPLVLTLAFMRPARIR